MRNPARSKRISTLLAASVAAIILFTIALLTGLDAHRQRVYFHRQIEEKGVLLARTLNDVLGNALYFDDVERLRHLVEAARANPEIRYLKVFAPDGRILVDPTGLKYPVGSVEPEVLQLAASSGGTRRRLTGSQTEFVKGIDVGNQIVGGVQFAFDDSALESQIDGMLQQHLWQALVVLAIGIGLSTYISRQLVRPVRRLTAMTRRIAAGDLKATVETQRRDEIGELAQAMQEMSETLRRSERERAERETGQLRSANQRLQAEVAERRRVQAERESLITELEAKTTEMERFTYTVSHDLRSPLVTIKGFLDLLERRLPEQTDERVYSDMRRIHSATERMKRLLDDLLEVSRAGQLSRPRESVDLTQLARQALELTAGSLSAAGVDAAIESGLPVVCGERDSLLQVFQNLIENAAKFTGRQASPVIRIGARQDGDQAVSYVRDNGLGIDPSHHDRIFGVFTQLDPDGSGSGVGLALVRRIIESHGGRVWVESEGTGTGSTFCFTIAGETTPDTAVT